MAYSKGDFVQFSDLDLDYFLGEYTNSEIELSDEECHDTRSNQRSNSVTTKRKRYICDQCSCSYASISGLRGHLRTRHSTASVKGIYILIICYNPHININYGKFSKQEQ